MERLVIQPMIARGELSVGDTVIIRSGFDGSAVAVTATITGFEDSNGNSLSSMYQQSTGRIHFTRADGMRDTFYVQGFGTTDEMEARSWERVYLIVPNDDSLMDDKLDFQPVVTTLPVDPDGLACGRYMLVDLLHDHVLMSSVSMYQINERLTQLQLEAAKPHAEQRIKRELAVFNMDTSLFRCSF